VLTQTGIRLKQLSKMPNGDLLDLSNSIGKFFWLDLYQVRVGQRLPNSLTPVFFGQSSVPQFRILNDPKRRFHQVFCWVG